MKHMSIIMDRPGIILLRVWFVALLIGTLFGSFAVCRYSYIYYTTKYMNLQYELERKRGTTVNFFAVVP